jgi:hypothetical protein
VKKQAPSEEELEIRFLIDKLSKVQQHASHDRKAAQGRSKAK